MHKQSGNMIWSHVGLQARKCCLQGVRVSHLRGEWLSCLYSLCQVTEVKLG